MSPRVTPKVINKVKQLIDQEKPESVIKKEISKLTGLGKTQTRQVYQDIISILWTEKEFVELPPEKNQAKAVFSGDTGTAESVGRIKTLEELLKVCNVDSNVWVTKNFICNSWEAIGKNSDGDSIPITLHQVKANLEKKKDELYGKKLLDAFIKNANSFSPRNWEYSKKKNNGKYLYYICAVDSHVGKEAYKAENGQSDYNLKNFNQIYTNAIDDLLERVPEDKIDEVLFLVGSDFFHSEGSKLETSSGTRLEGSTNWQEIFNVGCKTLTDTIEKIAFKHKITVHVVRGNHSGATEYYLGCFLTAWFRNNKNVTIDNSMLDRKYYTYGKSLIVNLHGDGVKDKELPLLVLRESNVDITKYPDVHIFRGHTHCSASEEQQGITIHTVKALCGHDSWHVKKGYWGKKGAEGFLFDKDYGLIANYIYNYV